MRNIQLKDAKAKFSELVDDAIRGNASVITRHGKHEAVVLGYKQWKKLSSVPSFGRLLAAAPFGPGDIPARSTKPLRSRI